MCLRSWNGTEQYVESEPTIAAQDCRISTKQERLNLYRHLRALQKWLNSSDRRYSTLSDGERCRGGAGFFSTWEVSWIEKEMWREQSVLDRWSIG